MRSRPVLAFVLRALAAFAVAVALWHALGPAATYPAALAAKGAVAALFPPWAEGVERAGSTLTLLTSLEAAGTAGARGRVALLSPEVEFLKYGFGLPLLAALLFAADGRRFLLRLAIGAALLVPFQAFGVCLDWLRQLAIGAGAAPFSAAHRELVAFGYQMGSLVFPALAPVLAWAWLDRAFLRAFVVEAAIAGAAGHDPARRH